MPTQVADPASAAPTKNKEQPSPVQSNTTDSTSNNIQPCPKSRMRTKKLNNNCDCESACHANCCCAQAAQALAAERSSELMPSDDTEILSAFFKALSDPTRLNIVFVLLKYKQLSVGEIATKTNMSISAVSHQLALLRMRKLVTVKRDGVKNIYALCDDHVSKVIEMAIEHIHEE